MRFARDFLSDGHADKCNNPSKSCLARLPGSFNSKCLAKRLRLEKSQVKTLQKWDGNKPSMLNLIGSFYSHLMAKKIEEEKRGKTNNYPCHNNQIKNRIELIEKLLKTPLKDYRKFCLWRILIPYLKNIKKLQDEKQIVVILLKWLDGCNRYEKLDFNPYQKIKENLRNVKDYKPIGLEKLKDTNAELYTMLI